MDMITIIAGTILLAIIRAFIPNHWLPLVAVAKVEKWELSDLMMVAAISATAHVLGTVLLGVAFGFLGSKLANQYEESVHIIVPIILILFGLLYFFVPFFKLNNKGKMSMQEYKRTKKKWILIFSVMMFLSPCLEVQSLFIAAGTLGSDNIFLLAQIYALVSIAGIMLLTYLAHKGSKFLGTAFIKNNAQRIAGTILIIVGIMTFFAH